MPRIVKGPLPFSPHFCLVTQSEEGELIDFERDYIGIDPRVYLRREVVEEAARDCLGMVSGAEIQTLRKQLESLGNDLVEAREQLSALQTLKDSGLAVRATLPELAVN